MACTSTRFSESTNTTKDQRTATTSSSSTGVIENSSCSENASHPLQNQWTLWYDQPKTVYRNHKAPKMSPTEFYNNMADIWSFDTAEGFWCLFNFLVPPSRIPAGANYHLFKKGIKPIWEDAANARGGRWTISLQREDRVKLDSCWQNTLLAMIGEMLDEEDDICGAVVSPRKCQDRISLWTKTANNEDLQRKIGSRMREVLNQNHIRLHYHKHTVSKIESVRTLKGVYIIPQPSNGGSGSDGSPSPVHKHSSRSPTSDYRRSPTDDSLPYESPRRSPTSGGYRRSPKNSEHKHSPTFERKPSSTSERRRSPSSDH